MILTKEKLEDQSDYFERPVDIISISSKSCLKVELESPSITRAYTLMGGSPYNYKESIF
jgi:hypothetical protein